jgi:hypothetical protein
MNLALQFEMLGRKQLAIQEGIDMLQQTQIDFYRARAAAKAWGLAAVMANFTLIPLNVIVNAFELKAANTAYKIFVRQLYGTFGKSGTRLDGQAKTALSLLKQAIIEELKRKGMTQFVPGVSILVGFAEDSMAAWRAVQLLDSGDREMSMLASNLERMIATANRQLLQLGIERAFILDRGQVHMRTA